MHCKGNKSRNQDRVDDCDAAKEGVTRSGECAGCARRAWPPGEIENFMSSASWFWLIVFLVSSFAAGALGSWFTAASVSTWYVSLNKPAFNPPNWIFGPVWTILYLMMAVSAWLVWRSAGWADGRVALTLFFIQLTFNLLWSVVFFGLRQPGLAMLEIVVLLATIIATAVAAMPVSKPAFWLLVPYMAWVAFAGVLNFRIWQLNS